MEKEEAEGRDEEGRICTCKKTKIVLVIYIFNYWKKVSFF